MLHFLQTKKKIKNVQLELTDFFQLNFMFHFGQAGGKSFSILLKEFNIPDILIVQEVIF